MMVDGPHRSSGLGRRSEAHGCDEVICVDDGWVLRCTCGWQTGRGRSAQEVGEAWDVHRARAH